MPLLIIEAPIATLMIELPIIEIPVVSLLIRRLQLHHSWERRLS